MNCHESQAIIDEDYLAKRDGGFPLTVQQHLISCQACREHRNKLPKILQTFQLLKLAPPSEQIIGEIALDLTLQHRILRERRQSLVRVAVVSIILAAAGTGIYLGFFNPVEKTTKATLVTNTAQTKKITLSTSTPQPPAKKIVENFSEPEIPVAVTTSGNTPSDAPFKNPFVEIDQNLKKNINAHDTKVELTTKAVMPLIVESKIPNLPTKKITAAPKLKLSTQKNSSPTPVKDIMTSVQKNTDEDITCQEPDALTLVAGQFDEQKLEILSKLNEQYGPASLGDIALESLSSGLSPGSEDFFWNLELSQQTTTRLGASILPISDMARLLGEPLPVILTEQELGLPSVHLGQDSDIPFLYYSDPQADSTLHFSLSEGLADPSLNLAGSELADGGSSQMSEGPDTESPWRQQKIRLNLSQCEMK